MLVSPEFILTAAHCIEDDVDDETTKYKVGAVCHRQNQNNCGQSSETLIVAERFSHPSYDSAGWDYDVALVKLAETASTTPVDMDLEGTVNSYNSNSKLRVIGFGDTNPDEGNYGSVQELPNHLQHVEVSYVPHATCNANYGGIITNNMMCAADPGEGRCRGDSGGPLYDDVNNLLVRLHIFVYVDLNLLYENMSLTVL
jgi:trypsin